MGGNWTDISTGLKLFVITVNGLLVIGLILLAVGMARTPRRLVEEAEGQAAQAAISSQSIGLMGEHRIGVAKGTRLRSIDADGGRLYLHVVDAGGLDRIIVLDAATGERRATILLEPAP